jgi:protoporphyrinogen oxidase
MLMRCLSTDLNLFGLWYIRIVYLLFVKEQNVISHKDRGLQPMWSQLSDNLTSNKVRVNLDVPGINFGTNDSILVFVVFETCEQM